MYPQGLGIIRYLIKISEIQILRIRNLGISTQNLQNSNNDQRLKEALSLFIPPYISRTNSFPGGSPEAERGFEPLHPPLYSSNKFISGGSPEVERGFEPLHPPLYSSKKIHFQEALQRLKEALSFFIPPYIGRTNSFTGGSPAAERGFEPLHPPLC